MQTDVLIVGAGPTGLALACQLTRFGVDFTVIDEKETTTPFSRAIGVQARTLEIYEQIGLAERLVALGRPADKVRMMEGGKVRAEAPLKDIGRGMSPYPFLLIVDQGLHEKELHKYLLDHKKDVRWNSKLASFTETGLGVTAKLASGETISAKYLVGCDGARSLVRQSLGLGFEGDTVDRLFYVADVEIDWELGHDAVTVCLAKSTITAFFPMVGHQRWRIVGTFPEGHKADEGEIVYEEIERQIHRDTEMELKISHVNWFSTYHVHSRAVDAFSKGRCFVAGDAAHIHSPAGAQGMNTGIQDGYNLAWKLAMVCRHGADAKLLASYNEERLPNAKRLLETTDKFFEFGSTDEWFLSYFRTHIFPYILGFALSLDVVKNALFPIVSQIGISYRKSSLSVDHAGFKVRAGDRMPYFKVGHSVYDELRSPKFHLLTFGGDGIPAEDDLADILDNHTLPKIPEVCAYFGCEDPFMVLLRPDNYVGLISRDFSIELVREYLRTILGPGSKLR